MSGKEPHHPQSPGARPRPAREREAARLQEELKSLEQMHSSLRALHQMVVSCNEILQDRKSFPFSSSSGVLTEQTLGSLLSLITKTINSLVQNNNTLTDMNKGWQIFFTGHKGDLK